jgi:phosphoribosylpyrophosphate synthetase
MTQDLIVFAGTGNPALAAAVAEELGVRVGSCTVTRFPDGETAVRINEPVRGREVFVVQPTGTPVNDNLIAASHGLFVADARHELSHTAIQEIFVTDSLTADRTWPRLRIVSMAPLFAEAISRIHAGGSLGNLYEAAVNSGRGVSAL